MRMVPRSPPLKSVCARCSTKLGRSVEPVSGSHVIGVPLGEEMEVKVPHSCAVSVDS